MTLSAERLRELLRYDRETGLFTWRQRTGSTATPGSIAGTKDARGYVRIGVDGHVYRAHRLAVLYVTGEWPSGEVDHRDGDKANNRYRNLRNASRSVNQQNLRAPHRRGSSGFLGVSFHAATGKWRARIWTDGGNKSLGLHETQALAHAAYVAAKRSLHEGCTL